MTEPLGWSDTVDRIKNERETTEARLRLLEAHVENLIERVYELEESQKRPRQSSPLDASGFEAEQRLKDLHRGFDS